MDKENNSTKNAKQAENLDHDSAIQELSDELSKEFGGEVKITPLDDEGHEVEEGANNLVSDRQNYLREKKEDKETNKSKLSQAESSVQQENAQSNQKKEEKAVIAEKQSQKNKADKQAEKKQKEKEKQEKKLAKKAEKEKILADIEAKKRAKQKAKQEKKEKREQELLQKMQKNGMPVETIFEKKNLAWLMKKSKFAIIFLVGLEILLTLLTYMPLVGGILANIYPSLIFILDLVVFIYLTKELCLDQMRPWQDAIRVVGFSGLMIGLLRAFFKFIWHGLFVPFFAQGALASWLVVNLFVEPLITAMVAIVVSWVVGVILTRKIRKIKQKAN